MHVTPQGDHVVVCGNLWNRIGPDGLETVALGASVDHRLEMDLREVGRIKLRSIPPPVFRALSPTDLRADRGPVEVQYLPDEDGVRQNVLVRQRPAGEGPLRVAFRLRTPLRPQLVAPDLLWLVDGEGHTALAFADLVVSDAEGRSLRAWFEVEPSGSDHVLRVVVDDAGATYPVLIDPVSSVPDLTLTGLASFTMGTSVASAGDLNGDGFSDLVIGAPGADLGQTDEGAAYVHYGSPTGISSTPDVIIQSDLGGAQLGFAVSTAGDVNGDGYSDLAVGAWRWQSSGAELREGAVFVHYGSAAGISATPDVILQTNHAQDFMGVSVACAGDVNNDGYSDIIAGGHVANYGQSEEGAVFVFLGSATGISTTWANRLERDRTFTQFGRAVAGAGDVNGDGYSDVLVGAHNYNNVVADDGAAFLYLGGPSGLGAGQNPAPDLIWFGDPVADGSFGWSVACAGDLNGDGYSDVAVGAHKSNDGGQSQEGTVSIFLGSAAGPSAVPDLKLDTDQSGSWFGFCVTSGGDLDGDGYADLCVGASHWANGQTLEGAVFVYHGGPTGLTPPQDLRIEQNSAGANLGQAVATAGDLNGDGLSDLVVGAPLFGNGGAAFVHYGGSDATGNQPFALFDGSAAGEHFGSVVAPAGDVNGDGYSDALIATPEGGSGGEGVLQLFLGSATGPGATADLTITGSSVGASPGFAFDARTAGDVNGDGYADVIAGAPFSGGGRALVFMGGPGGLSPAPAVTLVQPMSQFGRSVSAAGDVNSDGYADVIVGSQEAGAVVFLGSAGGVVTTPHLTLTGSGVGADVATAGDVNGDGYSDVLATESGAGISAIVWYGSDTGLVDLHRTSLPIPANQGVGLPCLGAFSVAGLGDGNGDGYDDILVGLPTWENNAGTADEGVAVCFYGAPGAIQTSGLTLLQGNLANLRAGWDVASAGDVNGDGYADAAVGIPGYQLLLPGEGIARLHLGRPGTLPPTTGIFMRGGDAGAALGTCVAGVGDLDGDGYSDVLFAAPDHDAGGVDAGRVLLGLGNRGGNIGRLTRQYQADLTNPLATNCMDFTDPDHFGIGHFARSPIQRNAVRMHWEVAFEGQAFSGNPITSGQGLTGASAAPIDIGVGGTEIKQLIYKTPNYIRYKWRVRLEYDKAKLIDGQPFSRWFHGYASGFGDIGVLPVELLTFDARENGPRNDLTWWTASEQNSHLFLVERSTDATDFAVIGSLPAAGNSLQQIGYSLSDESPPPMAYYRLRMVDLDGSWEYSPTVSVVRTTNGPLVAYPIPTHDRVHVPLPELAMGGTMELLDALGRVVRTWTIPGSEQQGTITLDLADLPAGNYMARITTGPGVVLGRARIVKH